MAGKPQTDTSPMAREPAEGDCYSLGAQLRSLLGDECFALFCQHLGGTRVYIPYTPRDDNEIVHAIGREASARLSRALAPATIRVPLARRERAIYFRGKGLSVAQIARKLGITENGVLKLFKRVDGRV